MKSRAFVATVMICLMSVFFSDTGYAQEKGKGDSEGIKELYNAARKEGRVVIWGPTDAIVYQRMQEALDKQYPGIKIESFESIPEPLVQRIIAESQAGKPAAVDVMQSGSLRALRYWRC
jgi:iron(III) transport system substrate-binding protein